MVYIKNWTDYEKAATELYARAPSKVRYGVKFVPKTGQLVLKVTDDVKCIKYKSHSSIILNRFESLNLRLLTQMSNTKRRAQTQIQNQIPTSTSAAGGGAGSGAGTPAIETPERGGTPALGGGGEDGVHGQTPAASAQGGKTGGGGGGGKKKKKGKR
ncbi:signal recognition particle subunit SRP9 [Kwoniella heveanensis BCC8398]|uniref:Signal recognition particle subunit SRP9 n=1 Tax=Kwoniella heveanensis BCC8398 TaxID=1296120 RepID=A0A1B9GX59_9TREE|nr:signal recognition particle subunit SRP9 [Kwoniella heveanensis BCC8398]